MRTAIATSGDFGPDELGEWLERGFPPAQAKGWISDGASLAEAEAWRAVGLAEPASALIWRLRGIGPGEARLLDAAGIAPVRRARRRLLRRVG